MRSASIERFHRLQFDYDFTGNDEVGFEAFVKGCSFIEDRKLRLSGERDPAGSKFTLEAFLIYLFGKPATEVVIDIECRSDETVAQLGERLIRIRSMSVD